MGMGMGMERNGGADREEEAKKRAPIESAGPPSVLQSTHRLLKTLPPVLCIIPACEDAAAAYVQCRPCRMSLEWMEESARDELGNGSRGGADLNAEADFGCRDDCNVRASGTRTDAQLCWQSWGRSRHAEGERNGDAQIESSAAWPRAGMTC